MRVRRVTLFFFFCTLAWVIPAHAAVVDSQLDDSAQAIKPPNSYYWCPFRVQMPNYIAVGYIPSRTSNIYGVRFRVAMSDEGVYRCPQGALMRYLGAYPPAAFSYGVIIGSLIPVAATTTPGIRGNCDYTTRDVPGRDMSFSLSPDYYYVFFLSFEEFFNDLSWSPLRGEPFSSSTPQSLFGYRPSTDDRYVWGTTGLDSAYFEFFDTAPPPPITAPSISLLGAATTTVEFGSTFTDPSAAAHDDVDGDITNLVHVTGSVNTSAIGTTTLAYSVTNSLGLSATTTREVVVACTHDCGSNVLFLPGIEGSRLYEGTGCGKAAEEKLWEPYSGVLNALRGVGDGKVRDLSLDETGASACSDVYAKEGDILDSVGGGNIYASFINQMNGLKGVTIGDWKSVAYDCRLSLSDLLTKGAQHGDKIYYEEATTTPYIEQTLRALASRSKTGKVTIVAHSNGGLVAKALMNKLSTEASSLVDKIVMVGVPQSGAPESIGSTLVGYNAGIYKFGLPIVSNVAARAFTQNSPMAYHLLPSASYLASIIDEPAHPVIHFTGDAYAIEIAEYGNSIVDLPALDDFLLAAHGEREKPSASDLFSPEILNPALVSYANSTHAALDAWTPPAGIEVSQIAGWGVDTVGGVDFYSTVPASFVGPAAAVDSSGLAVARAYRPILIEDGDGVVPVPSALAMATSTGVKRYWVDLHAYHNVTDFDRRHVDLFEIPSLRDFIKNLIENSTGTLPAYFSTTQPPSTSNKRLTFFLHSPLTLELTDASGNVTGLAADGSLTQDIPGSTYGEFGEVKYVSVPQGSAYELTMHGQATGTFSLDIQESSGGTVTNSSTIANVPTTESTLVSLTISDGIDTASPLTVDASGDGSNTFTVTPRVGETVLYEPPAPPVAPVYGGGAGGSSQASAVSTEIIPEPKEEAASTKVAAVEITSQLIATTSLPVSVTTPVATTAVIAVVSPAPRAARRQPASLPPTIAANTAPNLSQTASVYEASQQPLLKRLGAAVYNGWHGFWSALGGLFRLK